MRLTRKLRFLYDNENPFEEGRMAVIDIGSSMIRLVIYDYTGTYPYLLLNQKVWTELGKGKIGKSFILEEARMERTIAAIRWFLWIAEQANAHSVIAIASSAVREAKNGTNFVARVASETGLYVEIITGETEAILAAEGALAGMSDAKGIVVDLGGGSLELFESEGINNFVSFPLGILSLQAQSRDNPIKAVDILRKALKKVDWLKNHQGDDLVALGAGMRSIAKLHMDETNYPLEVLHDYRIEKYEAIDFCKRFIDGNVSQRLSSMVKPWKKVLPYRAAALVALLEETSTKRIRFATFGVREGVLFTQCAKGKVLGDPLILFAKDLATRNGRGVKYACNVAKWVGRVMVKIDKRILKTAALFAEIGWREHAAYRARSVFEEVLGGSFVACSHFERMQLASMVYFRHEDKLQAGMRKRIILNDSELLQTQQVGSLMRLATLLDPGGNGYLQEFSLVDGESAGLELKGPTAFMDMESESVAKRLNVINKLFLN